MESIRVLFFFILVLCVSHYVFFSLWNILNKPVTNHKFFEYKDRIKYVSDCFHKMNASVCGHGPEDLQHILMIVPFGQGHCKTPGILVNGKLQEQQQTDFESIEKWCFHVL